MSRRFWSPEDDAELRALYPSIRTDEVASIIGRSVCGVYGRAGTLGLHKSAAYLASPAACRLRRGEHVGKAYQHKKGQEPKNKGTRRPGWHSGRMKETQFKKGGPGTNTMSIGATRLIDGYVYRKISAVKYVPYMVNWKPEHILIWSAVHGPVPPKHALAFINGDRLDIRLENLELITRRQLMARNNIHVRLPEPLVKTVQLLGALKRKINRRARRERPDEKQDRRSA